MEPEEKGCGKIRGVWDACLAEDEESGTAKCEEHPAWCSLTRRAGRSAETAAGRRGPSSLVSGGRTLPCRRAPRSPGTHPPARGAPGRARQSGPDRRPGVGTRRGQTRALSGSHARHPALLVSRPLLLQVLGPFCTSRRISALRLSLRGLGQVSCPL